MPPIAKIILVAGLACLAAARPAPACAADDDANGGNGLEISGLIVDRTITKAGHDFHDLVVGYLGLDYESPYTLTILETAGVGRSTFVAVLIDDATVFRSRLNPLPEQVERLAQSATDAVVTAIAERRIMLRELEYY